MQRIKSKARNRCNTIPWAENRASCLESPDKEIRLNQPILSCGVFCEFGNLVSAQISPEHSPYGLSAPIHRRRRA